MFWNIKSILLEFIGARNSVRTHFILLQHTHTHTHTHTHKINMENFTNNHFFYSIVKTICI